MIGTQLWQSGAIVSAKFNVNRYTTACLGFRALAQDCNNEYSEHTLVPSPVVFHLCEDTDAPSIISFVGQFEKRHARQMDL